MNKLVLKEHDGEYRTQNKAIVFHNERNEVMCSVADCFRVDEADVLKLRQDFKDYWLMTSTRIDYKDNTVTHHVDSKVVKPKVYQLNEIPVCQPTYLKPLLETKSGLEFVRALLDMPKASKQQIIGLFVVLSGKNVDNIRFWTPTKLERKFKSSRAVVLGFDSDRFVVNGYNWIGNNYGLSRGVSVVSSAKQTQRKNTVTLKEIYNNLSKDFLEGNKINWNEKYQKVD